MKRLASAALTALVFAGGALLTGALARTDAALGEGKPKQDVSNMDEGLLRESLLKLWIIEFTSREYNQSRIAQKSFEGLMPAEPTGNPEIDRQNEAGRIKTNKELKHYLLLDLDGAIEAVDICDRVLGTKVSLDPADAEKRRFFTQELPEIRWHNILLKDLLADLSRMTGVPIELHPEIPKNVTLEVSFEAPAGFNVQSVLEYVNGIHPIEWTWNGGKLDVDYMGDLPKQR